MGTKPMVLPEDLKLLLSACMSLMVFMICMVLEGSGLEIPAEVLHIFNGFDDIHEDR